jgi:hypothetical protein
LADAAVLGEMREQGVRFVTAHQGATVKAAQVINDFLVKQP